MGSFADTYSHVRGRVADFFTSAPIPTYRDIRAVFTVGQFTVSCCGRQRACHAIGDA